MENNENFETEGAMPELVVETQEVASEAEQSQQTSAVDTPEEEIPAEQEAMPVKDTRSASKTILSYLRDVIYVLPVLIIVSLLLLRVVVVSGTSMNHTLLDGDYLLVLSNVLYREPEAGDIVVVSKESFDNGNPIVKRVIATEGQTVDIDFTLGIVYVDGVALDESYTYTDTNHAEGMTFPLTVEEGYIFCLGDNRNVSKDSRDPEIGQIAVEEVVGKVIFLFFPGTNGTDIYGNPKESRDFTRIGVVN